MFWRREPGEGARASERASASASGCVICVLRVRVHAVVARAAHKQPPPQRPPPPPPRARRARLAASAPLLHARSLARSSTFGACPIVGLHTSRTTARPSKLARANSSIHSLPFPPAAQRGEREGLSLKAQDQRIAFAQQPRRRRGCRRPTQQQQLVHERKSARERERETRLARHAETHASPTRSRLRANGDNVAAVLMYLALQQRRGSSHRSAIISPDDRTQASTSAATASGERSTSK